eukprot:scaffold128029_cov35-Prasinocladus_malaysianus.AAC.1
MCVAPQGAKDQLVQVERLAVSGNYNGARLQLRKGAMSNVRQDLREVPVAPFWPLLWLSSNLSCSLIAMFAFKCRVVCMVLAF